jgi:endonuclease-8
VPHLARGRAAYLADLRGATRCELATADEVDAVIARLGPDPLRADADPDRAWRRVAKSPRSIADLLMDQAVLAGVGNVYRSEILFRHRVDPHRPGREIRPATWRALWADLLLLMPIGVQLGQIVTMADQVEAVLAGEVDLVAVPTSPTGVSAWRPHPHGALERRYYVYRRQGEPCRVCGSRVRTEVVAGRHLYWCGRCQRRR